MKISSSTLLNIILVTTLITSFFFVNATADHKPTYSPWTDLNDDGKIDLYEYLEMAMNYGATGIPVNKTALLYEVNNTFTGLLSRFDDLETQIPELETKLAVLNATYTEKIENLTTLIIEMNMTITNLGTSLDILNATKLGKSDYDTFEEYGGWVSLPTGDKMFTHNLGTTDVLVYVVGYHPLSSPYIHQIEYGGETSYSGLYHHGVYWHELSTTTITVHRHGNDGNWQYVRVIIWKIPES